jgi:hypothetical protein
LTERTVMMLSKFRFKRLMFWSTCSMLCRKLILTHIQFQFIVSTRLIVVKFVRKRGFVTYSGNFPN